MFKALTKVGSMACRILELAGTPIDDRYSLCVCPCTGVFAIVEFSRKNPGETPAGGFSRAAPALVRHAVEARLA